MDPPRWIARGAAPDDVLDVAMWAVPFRIAGGRPCHVITDLEFYSAPSCGPARN